MVLSGAPPQLVVLPTARFAMMYIGVCGTPTPVYVWITAPSKYQVTVASAENSVTHETSRRSNGFWRSRKYPDLLDIADIGQYDSDDAKRFDNSVRRELYGAPVCLLARTRLQNGSSAEAHVLLEQVPSEHPYAAHAAKCLELTRSQP